MKYSSAWDIDNVISFRNCSVYNGEVSLTDEEFAEYIDDVYESVSVAGNEFSASDVLRNCDPVAWRVGKGDYESQLDSELQDQLDHEDATDIEFEVDPDDWEDEDEEEQDDEGV
ncbi:hypothetical protein D3C78_1010810 [compost metagenome]